MCIALFVAPLAALLCGPAVSAWVTEQEFISWKGPESVLRWIIIGVTSLAVYFAFSAIGPILFKRTRQKTIGITRFVYAIGGAALGLTRALVLIWVLLCLIRVTGTLTRNEKSFSTLAALKLGIEQGALGALVEATTDPVVSWIPNDLSKLVDFSEP